MGIYLNPGNQSFQISLNSEIFVDKTELILYLNNLVNTQQRFVCVSRPRRFGKTMAADMICAYYGREADSRALFENRKLSRSQPIVTENRKIAWDSYLGGFDVIRLVMTDFIKENREVSDGIEKLRLRVLNELHSAYPEVRYDPSDLTYSMDLFYNTTGVPFVIVIDEWDALFRVRKEDREGQRDYLDFLRDWMKDKPYIALAYMTGILPIKKYGKHSALNMFTEYSMMFPRDLASCTGFTEGEVRDLCGRYKMDYTEVSDWYDGYTVSDLIPLEERDTSWMAKNERHRVSLYSPLSIVECMLTGRIRNYWNKTETYEALAEYIRRDYDGLKEAVALLMDGARLQIDTSTYQNDMTTFSGRDDVLSLLVHLGYLGFDDAASEVFIPNKEILDEFRASTKSREWTDTFRAYERSEELLRATWERDAARVAELLEAAHDRAANKTYHDEAALSYAVQLAYYAAQKYYTILPEADTGKGFADLLAIPSARHPDKPALVIELKYNKDARGAIAQIKERNYPDRLEHYKGRTLLVGIDYDRESPDKSPDYKHHTCIIEEA